MFRHILGNFDFWQIITIKQTKIKPNETVSNQIDFGKAKLGVLQ